MLARQNQALRYKVFRTNGDGDFLRTPMGEVRLFTDLEQAREVAAEAGGMVLWEGAPAPGGFDRALS